MNRTAQTNEEENGQKDRLKERKKIEVFRRTQDAETEREREKKQDQQYILCTLVVAVDLFICLFARLVLDFLLFLLRFRLIQGFLFFLFFPIDCCYSPLVGLQVCSSRFNIVFFFSIKQEENRRLDDQNSIISLDVEQAYASKGSLEVRRLEKALLRCFFYPLRLVISSFIYLFILFIWWLLYMCVFLCVCLYDCLFLTIFSYVRMFVSCLFVRLCVCLRVCLFVCLFPVCSYVSVFICMFVCLYIVFVWMFVCVSVSCLFICLFAKALYSQKRIKALQATEVDLRHKNESLEKKVIVRSRTHVFLSRLLCLCLVRTPLLVLLKALSIPRFICPFFF